MSLVEIVGGFLALQSRKVTARSCQFIPETIACQVSYSRYFVIYSPASGAINRNEAGPGDISDKIFPRCS